MSYLYYFSLPNDDNYNGLLPDEEYLINGAPLIFIGDDDDFADFEDVVYMRWSPFIEKYIVSKNHDIDVLLGFKNPTLAIV